MKLNVKYTFPYARQTTFAKDIEIPAISDDAIFLGAQVAKVDKTYIKVQMSHGQRHTFKNPDNLSAGDWAVVYSGAVGHPVTRPVLEYTTWDGFGTPPIAKAVPREVGR